MDVIIVPFLKLILTVIDLYRLAVIIMVFLSLLQGFGLVNMYNRVILAINDFLFQVTEPALRPLRSILPRTGFVDLSPLVLILLLGFLQNVIHQLAVKISGL